MSTSADDCIDVAGWNGFTFANPPDWLCRWNEDRKRDAEELQKRQELALEVVRFLAETGCVNTPGFMWVDDGSGVAGLIEAAVKAHALKLYKENR